jgi:8-oxo-dGTP pyrophosphatase MutT (NUDIX family)
MNKSRTHIATLIRDIDFGDSQEQADIATILEWIDSGADLYRKSRPDVPYRHLVAYFVVIDAARRKLLLLDHMKASLWLPAGGHVESDEEPRATVFREFGEELGTTSVPVITVADKPLFVTLTKTRGANVHEDVSLWYVVAGDEHMWLDVDRREFRSYRWLSWDQVKEMDPDVLDPGMHRFMDKLEAKLARIP